MARKSTKSATDDGGALPPLPLGSEHWLAIVQALGLSPRQAEIASLMARGAQLKEIASLLEISVSTVRTQQDRIFDKTDTNGRGDLLVRILGVSHQVGCCPCRQKR